MTQTYVSYLALTLIILNNEFFFIYLQVVAMMQVGNLPLPLPILTPALHADFPSVHIGIKVSWEKINLLWSLEKNRLF